MLPKIHGIILDQNTLRDFNKRKILIYYDGPLLEILTDDSGRYYLVFWSNYDKETNITRCIYVPQTRDEIQTLRLRKTLNFYQMIKENRNATLIVDEKGNNHIQYDILQVDILANKEILGYKNINKKLDLKIEIPESF